MDRYKIFIVKVMNMACIFQRYNNNLRKKNMLKKNNMSKNDQQYIYIFFVIRKYGLIQKPAKH